MTNQSSDLPVAMTGDVAVDTAQRILVFEMEIPIRWADQDALRHVNNVAYFRYLEQTRISWLDALGIQHDNLQEGPLIINAFCSFVNQLSYPGTVLARLSVGQFGRSSVQTFVDMSRTDEPDTIYAAGGAKVVWVDHRIRKSAQLPADVRQRMAQPVGLLRDQIGSK